MTKIDDKWEEIFRKYNILSILERDNKFPICADQIKKFYEPRLMTKFDFGSSLPKIFRDNNLSILPDSRGTYLIGRFKAYYHFDYQELKPIRVQIPNWVRTFDNLPVSSEALAINVAQMTGMIDYVMNNNDNQISAISTLNGRLSSQKFSYYIDLKDSTPVKIDVENSQMEIDGAFETSNLAMIIEAKNTIPNDFIIRQLYYPFRMYNNIMSNKLIVPVYLTHVDGIYGFHIFEFNDIDNYSSINKIKQINFIVDQQLNLDLMDVKSISDHSKNLPESNTQVFPQADSLSLLMEMLSNLINSKDKYELVKNCGYQARQGDYYGNALVYLGFAEKIEGKFQRTELGNRIARMSNSNDRNRIIIQQIINHKVFNVVFKYYLKHNELSDDYIDKVLIEHLPNLSSETIKRRRSTVKYWLNWIIDVAA